MVINERLKQRIINEMVVPDKKKRIRWFCEFCEGSFFLDYDVPKYILSIRVCKSCFRKLKVLKQKYPISFKFEFGSADGERS